MGEAKLFELDEAELAVMEQLKEKLTTPLIVALPKREKRHVIDSDACEKQVGCVLQQEKDGCSSRPIGYWSQTLNVPKRWYNITHRECLAVVWEILLLRPFNEESRFTVRTDY